MSSQYIDQVHGFLNQVWCCHDAALIKSILCQITDIWTTWSKYWTMMINKGLDLNDPLHIDHVSQWRQRPHSFTNCHQAGTYGSHAELALVLLAMDDLGSVMHALYLIPNLDWITVRAILALLECLAVTWSSSWNWLVIAIWSRSDSWSFAEMALSLPRTFSRPLPIGFLVQWEPASLRFLTDCFVIWLLRYGPVCSIFFQHWNHDSFLAPSMLVF